MLSVTVVQADISGPVRIIDGDTLDLAGQRIRLYGIDAPERDQACTVQTKEYPCGVMATAELTKLTLGQDVRCDGREHDRYGRLIAVCYVGKQELNATLVRNGWAFAYLQYSSAYVGAEEEARKAQRGVWQGRFVPPWEWRRGVRLAQSKQKTSPAQQSDKCLIKGNIGRSGERIYHVPGGQYYKRTKINPSKGERWFCTEEEATTAGWRPSKR